MELFERVGGRLQPTSEAHALLPEVEEIFEKVDLVSQLLKEMREGKSRALTVASSPTLANTILCTALSRFRKSRPQTKITILAVTTNEVIELIEKREADVGLVYGTNLPGRIDLERLVASPIVCAFPANHRLADKTTVSPDDLVEESLISLGENTIVKRTIDMACREAGLPPPKINISASSAFAGCMMVAEGGGVALIDQSTFLSDFFHTIVYRPFIPACSVDLALVLPRSRRPTPAARHLGAILGELCRNPPAGQRNM